MYPVTIICPVEKSHFFEKVSYDKAQRTTLYRLKVQKLSKDECHMFWDFKLTNARLIARALEFITFHPNSKLNDKFNIVPIICGKNMLFLCSFPKEYKETCKRAAETFGMRIKNGRSTMIGIEEREDLIDPSLTLTLSNDHKEKGTPFKQYVEKEEPMREGALKEYVKKHIHVTAFEFPKADNILWFGKNLFTESRLTQLEEEIAAIGNCLQELGID